MAGACLLVYNTPTGTFLRVPCKLRRENPLEPTVDLMPNFSIRQLFDLQELDQQASAHEKALAEVRARLADDSAVTAAADRLRGLESQLKEPTSGRDEIELQIYQLQEKLGSVEQTLYGGTITNPRELTAYESEQKILHRQRSEQEERLLELLVSIEEIQQARNEARDHLARLETERAAELSDLTADESRLVGLLEELGQARRQIAPKIPPAALMVYESVRKSRAGYAVAKVERSLCQGCRVALSSLELQRVRTSHDIIQCDSCNRILYVA